MGPCLCKAAGFRLKRPFAQLGKYVRYRLQTGRSRINVRHQARAACGVSSCKQLLGSKHQQRYSAKCVELCIEVMGSCSGSVGCCRSTFQTFLGNGAASGISTADDLPKQILPITCLAAINGLPYTSQIGR